jgi:glucosamine-6-phosphate deaminase
VTTSSNEYADAAQLKTMQVERLPVRIFESREALGRAAAADASEIIRRAIAERGEVNLILATGNSQLAFLEALRSADGIDWSRARVFHMDEYVGIDPGHRASFPRFLRQHFLDHIKVGSFRPISGDRQQVDQTCRDYADELRRHPADLVALGLGENGHLAFNDPPYADFDDPELVKVVRLDEVSRRQQVGEGHFDTLDEVPEEAITLTIPALLAASRVLCIVPEARKAQAVHDCLLGPVTEDRPGSVLRRQEHATVYLDRDSAGRL